jgi:hypothetical protein
MLNGRKHLVWREYNLEEGKKSIITVTDENGNTIAIKGCVGGYVIRNIGKAGLFGPSAIKKLDKTWYKKKVLIVMIDELI